MHDVGKLIFELFTPKEYAEVRIHSEQKKMSLLEAEIGLIGISHADIGRILADKWALPLDLEYAIVHHHHPLSVNKIKELVSLIHIADAVSHQLHCGLWDDETPPPELKDARKILSIDDAWYSRIIDSMTNEIEKYHEFLSIIEGKPC